MSSVPKSKEKFSEWYYDQPVQRYEQVHARRDIIQRLDDERKRKLVPQLGEYIFSRYSTTYGTTHKGKNKAKTKARYILELTDKSKETNFSFDRRFPPRNASELSLKGREKILEKAEANGYLPDLRLDQTWHPQPFFNGELVSYPVQHPNFVTYRAMSRSAFYKKVAKVREGSRHSRSVLDIGEIKPGNSVDSDNESAVWTCPRMDKIKTFANEVLDFDGVIIELNLPSHWLSFNTTSESLETVEDFEKEFGSPEKFREFMTSGKPVKYLSFLINEKNARGVPLERITGIWDLQLDKEEKFRKFDESYVEVLNKLEPYNTPGENDKIGKKLQQEYTRLIQIQDYLGERKDNRGQRTAKTTINWNYCRTTSNLESVEDKIKEYEEVWITEERSKEGLLVSHKEHLHSISDSISKLNRSIIELGKLVETTENVHKEIEETKIETLEDAHQFAGKMDKDLEKIGDHITQCRIKCMENIDKLNKIRTQYANSEISGEEALEKWKEAKDEVKIHKLNKEIISNLRIGKVDKQKLWKTEKHRS